MSASRGGAGLRIVIVTDPRAGTLDEDLRAAVRSTLTLDPADARSHACAWSWEQCARMFLDNVRAGARSG